MNIQATINFNQLDQKLQEQKIAEAVCLLSKSGKQPTQQQARRYLENTFKLIKDLGFVMVYWNLYCF